MEQLQAKELELLQLKTEMETSQGPDQSSALLPFYIIVLTSRIFKTAKTHTLHLSKDLL